MKKAALRVFLVLISFAVCGEVYAQNGKQQPPPVPSASVTSIKPAPTAAPSLKTSTAATTSISDRSRQRGHE